MDQSSDTRLIYDSDCYSEKLKRTIAPGMYMLNTPYNDCNDCSHYVADDPTIRFQSYGPNTCTMKNAVNDSSELQGLNYKLSKCNTNQYLPDTYKSTSSCYIKNEKKSNNCSASTESTRLSNPPCTLKGTGINRWEWLCVDPQDKALEEFNRIPVNYRMVSKDNHVPLLDVPEDQNKFLPDNKDNKGNPMDKIDNKRLKGNSVSLFAPGQPFGYMDYNMRCK